MSETLEFIKHDFNLPNHDNELSKAGDVIEKLKQKINNHVTDVEIITDKQFIILYEEIVRVLDYVGRLSMPAFAIEDEMEEMYKMKFLHAPELGKKLWLDHYENVHRPYTILKNRCFKLLDELDEYYQALYDKKPPNYNP
jgi:hypothetical protein